MSEIFQGLWPAMFTPVRQDGAPDTDQLEKLVDLLISQELDGLYILGSTGQGVLFSEKQRMLVTETVTNVASRRIPIMVQVGSLTTAESVRLAKHAQSCGVDGISSVGPIYFSGNAPMALEHYKAIAASTDLPFFPYQLGDHSIPGDLYFFIEQLLALPTVQGMKLTTNQLLEISSIHNFAGDRLRLFSGSDELFCHAALCGCAGAIGSFYNLWGVACKDVLTAFKSGNYLLAKQFMLSLQKTIKEVLPNVWTFFRKAMLLKYGVDIGNAKAPLGNTHAAWDDAVVLALIEKVEATTSLGIGALITN